jgi:hypothetical protein
MRTQRDDERPRYEIERGQETMTIPKPKVAVVWRGDREARRMATPKNNRYHRVFEELAALGIHAEPAVFDEAFADEVREQLLAVDGVLVWSIRYRMARHVRCSTRCCATSRRADRGSARIRMSYSKWVRKKSCIGRGILEGGTDTHIYPTSEPSERNSRTSLRVPGPPS